MIRRLSVERLAIAILESPGESETHPSVCHEYNANVLYEIGIRHAWCMPVVIMAPSNLVLPFDLRDYVAVSYPPIRRDPSESRRGVKWQKSDVRTLRSQLRSRIEKVRKGDIGLARFKEGLRFHQERFGLELVKLMKRETLSHLDESLGDFLEACRRDYEKNAKGTFDAVAAVRVANLPRFAIQDFHSDVAAFERVSKRHLNRIPATPKILEVCKIMRKIDQANELLLNDLTDQRKETWSVAEIRNAVMGIQKQIADCLHKLSA